MDLPRLLETFSTFEKRAMALYRRLGSRFQDAPPTSRLWIEMSNVEAGHFAVIALAEDWVRIGGEAVPSSPDVTETWLDEIGERLQALERRGENNDLSLAEAVQLALEWEETELPHVLALASALPPDAGRRLLAGLLGEAGAHYRCLSELAGLAGVTSIEGRLDELRKTAADAARASA